MSAIRPLRPEDLPDIVALHRRAFGGETGGGSDRNGNEMEPSRCLNDFLRAVLLEHPWMDPDLPSLVYENGSGIAGFLGIMPRPMRFDDTPVRAAVSHNFMVDRHARAPAAALQLSRAAFELPLDVLLADGNDASRKIWERGGGRTSVAGSLRWRKLLSPVSYGLSRVAGGRFAGKLPGAVAAPLDRLARRCAPRLLDLPPRTTGGNALGPGCLQECLEKAAARRRVEPLYDRAALEWLLKQLQRRRPPTRLRGRVVTDAHGDKLGWYLYYARPGGIAEVVQMGACHPRDTGRVLSDLFHDARDAGAAGVSGQVDPPLLHELTAAGCLLDGGKSWLLVHATRPDLGAAIERGEAFLTRLECEGWIRLAHT